MNDSLPVLRTRDGLPDMRLVLPAEADHPANWLGFAETEPTPVYAGQGEWVIPRRCLNRVVQSALIEFGYLRMERAA